MTSCIQPRHDCSGGFIGLVWNVSSNLEEIEDFYDEILKYDYYGDDYDECFDDHNNSYMSIIWSDALSKFLGFNDSDDLSNWAKENPKLWGCKHGSTMFFSSYSYLADDVVVDKFTLTHRDIINWVGTGRKEYRN